MKGRGIPLCAAAPHFALTGRREIKVLMAGFIYVGGGVKPLMKNARSNSVPRQSFSAFFSVLSVLALFLACSSSDLAAGQVKVLQQWRGAITLSEPELPIFAADEETLARVWNQLKIQKKKPVTNFSETLFLFAAVHSSVVLMSPSVDDDGNLTRNIIATPDAPGYQTVVVLLIPRAGIRTVEGKSLPE